MSGTSAVFIAATIIFFTSIAMGEALNTSDGYLDIKNVTMRLDGGNATFELNYTLDPFTRLYVLALGCRYLEPELKSFLGGYSRIKLVKADTEGASLIVEGAGKYNSGYFLFDSTPFGTRDNPRKDGIDRFSVIYPEGRTKTFYNVTSTQSVYSQAGAVQSHRAAAAKSTRPEKRASGREPEL